MKDIIEKLKVETYNFSRHDLEDREKLICGLKIVEKISPQTVANEKGIKNIVQLITCGRVEFIYLGDEFIGLNGFDKLESWDALYHLVKVASGISTLIPGETQILNQLKKAFFDAMKKGLCNGKMMWILSEILRISRTVREKAQIQPQSFSSLVKKVAEEVIGNLSDKTLFVIGTGTVAHDIFRAAKNFSKIIVYSRTPEKAVQIAIRLETHLKAKAEYLSSIKEGIEKSDVVVTATNHPGYLIHREHLENIRKKIALFDFSVPRNISPDVKEMGDNIFLFDIDVIAYQNKNSERLEEAKRYVKTEIEKLKARLERNKKVQRIAKLDIEFKKIISEHLRKYTNIDEDEITKISKSLSKKLLSRFFAESTEGKISLSTNRKFKFFNYS